MAGPFVVLCQGGGDALYQLGVGADDDGSDITVRGQTVPQSPTGPGGEAIFPALYIAITHTMACTIRFTPVVDGTELESQEITLEAVADRELVRYQLGLSVGYENPPGVEVMRTAPRGVWFWVIVELDEIAAGDLIFEELEVEHEVVRESEGAEALS